MSIDIDIDIDNSMNIEQTEWQLSLSSETELENRASTGFPVTCPTLDLAATWDSVTKNVLLYRPPSQVVSKIHQLGPPGTKGPEALAITWKADGQFLAVGWSDGVVRLMGLENNKAAHHIEVCPRSNSIITHIGWACNDITSHSSGAGWLQVANGLLETLNVDNTPADLPRDLIFLEVETALPKISPLPGSSAGTGEDSMVFTLRTGIEFLFQTPEPRDYDRVNVMVVGTSDGGLHLSIYDSFVIGKFFPGEPDSQLIHHASSPLVSTHSLLFSKTKTRPNEVFFMPMDLPFISSSPINLSLLASKLTSLQTLLRYLKQTQLHMQVEWKNTRELPNRFQSILQEDLDGMTTGPSGVVSALYHTAVTGHAYPAVKDWLVDSMAERGHKRWDKAVVSGLENLRSLVHENFLPALERCSIILSRLRGLAQFYDSKEEIGFSVTNITKAMDIIGCLSLVGHKMLLLVMDELDHFTTFSTWLRAQIDHFASSSDNDAMTEKEATMDNGKVITYIDRYLTDSPLRVFFDEIPAEDYASEWDHIQDGSGLLDLLEDQLAKYEMDAESMRALPRLEFLVDYVTDWSSRIFEDIAEAKKRSVRFGEVIKLSIQQPIDVFDVRMCGTNENSTVFVALASKEPALSGKNHVHIFQVKLNIIGGISSNEPVLGKSIDIDDRTVFDLKFVDDENIMLLCYSAKYGPHVVSCSYQTTPEYRPYDPSNPDDLYTSCVGRCTVFELPDNIAMKPVKMEVFDHKEMVNGGYPKRICLLGENRTTLRTFTLPEKHLHNVERLDG